MRSVVGFLVLIGMAVPAFADDVFLFSFFRNNGKEGMFLASSEDGLTWSEIQPRRVWLKPEVGRSVLMRDPCIVPGPDDVFHMVWTPGWGERGIGHASSKDLINWSAQQYIDVMSHEPKSRNAWAPEIFYDSATEQWLIFWATTIPGRFPETDATGDARLNHRMYYKTTKDFVAFTETRLFYDPGFNVIDSTVQRIGDRYVMFLKNESLRPHEKNIRIATAANAAGPYSKTSPPITGDYRAEGPTALKVGDYWYVYFDKYTDHQYGAVRSKDLDTWEDVSDTVSFPEGIRHGTAFTASRSVLMELRAAAK
jgi:hypothetical protein